MNILIIGPGAHFGSVLVDEFTRNGHDVIVASRHVVSLPGARWLHVDVSCQASVRSMLASVPWTSIDSVVYNVKYSPSGSFTELDPADLLAALDINVVGLLRLIQEAYNAKHFKPGSRPVVLATGGGFKDKPHSSKLALSLSKSALHALSENLRISALSLLGLQLKTLVIDGVVRQEGPIDPKHVANVALSMLSGDISNAVCTVTAADSMQQPLYEAGV